MSVTLALLTFGRVLRAGSSRSQGISRYCERLARKISKSKKELSNPPLVAIIVCAGGSSSYRIFAGIGKGEALADSLIKSIDQVAVVVRDLDRAMKRYTEEFGIGPWSVYTFSPDWIGGMTFRGREQPYSMKLALAFVGEMMYELIEPVQGPNSYEEFLNEHGEGLHHLGYFVEDIDSAIEEMEGKGYPLLQSGRGFGTEGAYAYFETEDALGCIVEAIEMPQAMPDPERIFPE